MLGDAVDPESDRSDDKSTSRQFGNVFEPEELNPRNMGQARLLVRGTPGQLMQLIEWTDFVKYLDELRGARRAVGSRNAFHRLNSDVT